jgi:MFS family permease
MRSVLRNPAFRRLFLGRVVTNAGDSLYYVAATWLVYDLTGSSLFTGLATVLVLGPAAFQFLFGPLVDRWPLRRVLVGTQVSQMLLVLVVPLAWALDLLSVWLLLAVMPLLSLLNQPVYPAESAALPRLVARDELVAANSAFSVAYQGVDAAFNALGGLLVALVGAVTLFLVDSVTFAVAALLFLGLRIPAAGTTDGRDETVTDETGSSVVATDGSGAGGADGESYLDALRAGFALVRGTVVSRAMAATVVANASIGGVLAALPAYGDALGGEVAYGLAMAAIGGGLLVGALVAGAFDDRPLGRMLIAGSAFSAATWALAIALGWLPVTVTLLAVAFVPVGVTNVLFVSMMQALVPETSLGRVMALVGSVSAGATPVGGLLGGALASVTTPALVMFGGSVGFAFIAAFVLAVPELRRLPRVADVETLAVE